MKKQLGMMALAVCMMPGGQNYEARKLKNNARAIEIAMYDWYIQHYTDLDAEDIANLKKAWEENPNLHNDPNVVKTHRVP